MADRSGTTPTSRQYFVDEAGDPNLFKRRGKPIVGEDGCSTFFIPGVADVADPETVAAELNSLRQTLIADPYFKDVPSFDPARGKTAVAFHAKDDLPEVRREVFKLLLKQDIRFYAVVRDKRVILEKVREHQTEKPTYRFHPNQLYDRCVSRLFKERLHKHDGYLIHFAKRGSSDRTEALEKALEAARRNLRASWGIAASSLIEIRAGEPKSVVCLQVADYYLWALQRLFERREDRFLQQVWSQVGLILNGKFNVIQPVSFTTDSSDDSVDRACRYGAEGDSLASHEDETWGPMKLIVVGRFRSKKDPARTAVKNYLGSHNATLHTDDRLNDLVQLIVATGKDINTPEFERSLESEHAHLTRS